MILSKKPKFEVLTDSADRRRVLKRIEKIVSYAHEKNVGLVIGLDKSGRPTTMLFREVWKRKFPEEKVPDCFFLSPDLWQVMDIDFAQEAPAFKEKIKQQNLGLWKNLNDLKDKKVLVLDDLAFSGMKITGIENLLHRMGVKNILSAVLAKDSMAERLNPDIFGGTKPKKLSYTTSQFLALSKSQATAVKERGMRIVAIGNPNPVSNAMRYDIKRLAQKARRTRRRVRP